jgi:hypothetical protein
MLYRCCEDLLRLVEVAARIEHAIHLGPILGPFLDLVEITVVRDQRVGGFFLGHFGHGTLAGRTFAQSARAFCTRGRGSCLKGQQISRLIASPPRRQIKVTRGCCSSAVAHPGSPFSAILEAQHIHAAGALCSGDRGATLRQNTFSRSMRPARYVLSVAIFAGNQDHIGLDVSPIAASTPSPIFPWRCSRFHERSGNQLSAGITQSNQNKNVHGLVDNIGDAPPFHPGCCFVVKRPLTAAIHNRGRGVGVCSRIDLL